MTGIITINHNVNSAEQFKEMVSEPTPNTKLYLAYGKSNPWSNEASPDQANSSVLTVYDVWNDMIAGKKITANDLRHVIPRYNWESNTNYIAYSDKDDSLFNDNVKFYVVTSDYRVYKCLSNNNSQPSTVEPTSVNQNTATQTSDGYIWKFMYELSDQDLLRYTTDNYVPVKTLITDDSTLQWHVQTGAIDGSIDVINITNSGNNYTNISNLVISFIGDGSGLTANVSLNTSTKTLSSIIVTNPGSDYTYATVSISGGGGTGAAAEIVKSPPGGHGSNPLYELGGRHVIIDGRFVGDENSIFPVTNDFRTISLIIDPYISDGSRISDNSTIFQGYTLATAGAGDYLEDEIIYQGSSIETSSFSGRVLSWNSTSSIVTTIDNIGSPATGSLIGANSAVSRFLTSSQVGDLAKYSGKLIYIDNIPPVSRSFDQTEDFKIVLHF